MVLLRLDKLLAYAVADFLAVKCGLGHCADHVDNRARNLVGNFLGIQLGQIVRKNSRRFFGDCVLVDARNRNLFADALRHFLVVGGVDRRQIERLAQLIGNYIRNCVVV